MTQSKADSFMEAVINVVIGTIIYTVVNYTILASFLGIPISVGQSLAISGIFTVVSVARSYIIRRLFNGKSVWESIKQWHKEAKAEMFSKSHAL